MLLFDIKIVYFHLQVFFSCFFYSCCELLKIFPASFISYVYDYYLVLHFLVIIHIAGFVKVKLSESVLKNLRSCERKFILVFWYLETFCKNLVSWKLPKNTPLRSLFYLSTRSCFAESAEWLQRDHGGCWKFWTKKDRQIDCWYNHEGWQILIDLTLLYNSMSLELEKITVGFPITAISKTFDYQNYCK